MSKSALTVLREARELISDPKRWTQQVYAKDGLDQPRLGYDSRAVCWCADGALQRVCPNELAEPRAEARNQLERAALNSFSKGYVWVNDTLGHSDILKCFDAAIASAEKEAQS